MKTSREPKDLEAVTLGEFVRELRAQNGLSLREFAKKAKISPSFLSRIELDQGFPSSAMLERIALALDVPAAQLKGFDTRIQMDELRRMLQKSLEFRSAMFLLITQAKRDPKRLARIAEQIETAVHNSSAR